MKTVVVGAGSWGTAFARLLADRGHAVTLAARDPNQAQAIRDTGRNPRYQRDVDLSDIAATTIDDAPYEDTDVVVVAIPSKAFGQTVRSLPGRAPILSLS